MFIYTSHAFTSLTLHLSVSLVYFSGKLLMSLLFGSRHVAILFDDSYI
jgi:hypothetical protein